MFAVRSRPAARQGHPVIVQAGSSADGQALPPPPPKWSSPPSRAATLARTFTQGLKDKAEAAGRRREDILVMPGVTIYVAATRAEAQAKFDALQAFVDAGQPCRVQDIPRLGSHRVDIDGPPPPPPSHRRLAKPPATRLRSRPARKPHRAATGRTHGRRARTPRAGRNARGHRRRTGSLVPGRAADGFNILAPILPQGLDDIIELVLPELRRRGLFRTEYEGTSLREHLGLPARNAPNPRPGSPASAAALYAQQG
jgi:alkanesulfonate monooxygenase SsuD/methylene tetrahydromethanopterin reductase-like flavin-dependent oxidoreductase (luciferase family)